MRVRVNKIIAPPSSLGTNARSAALRTRSGTAALALCLVVTSCGQAASTQRDPDVATTSETGISEPPSALPEAPAGEPAAPAGTSAASPTTEAGLAPPDDPTTTSTSTPMAPSASPRPPIVVAGPEGIHLIGDAAEIALLDTPVISAVDDRLGGLLYQVAAGRYFNDPETTIVYWLPSGSRDGSPLLVPTGRQWLRLVDVEIIGGATAVVYIRSEGDDQPEDVRDTLRTYDMVSGEVHEVATVGGWESGVGQVSFGAGTYALNWSAEGLSGFDFRDVSGSSIEVAANPYSGDVACFDGTMDEGGPCAENVSIDDTGAVIAYVELRRDADGTVRGQDLVVVSIDGTGPQTRIDLGSPEGEGSVAHIDLAPGHAIVNRRDNATLEYGPASVVDLVTGSLTQLDRSGQARFTSSIPAP